jgi:hypothetical protein
MEAPKHRDPAREFAEAFTRRWAERTGSDLYGVEAEQVYEQAYADASEGAGR